MIGFDNFPKIIKNSHFYYLDKPKSGKPVACKNERKRY